MIEQCLSDIQVIGLVCTLLVGMYIGFLMGRAWERADKREKRK